MKKRFRFYKIIIDLAFILNAKNILEELEKCLRS